MARMDLDTAIRLSADVKGGANITKVQSEIQNLAKNTKLTAREMGTLRAATFQLARTNDGTIAGLRSSAAAFRGLQEQVKIGSREYNRYGAEIQKLEGKLKGLDGTAKAAGSSLGKQLATGLAAAGIGRALQGITMQAAAYEGELRKAAAIEGGAGSFGVLRKEIEAVASVAAGTPTEVATLATALSRAGFSAKETATALRGVVLGAEATSISFEEMGSIAADNLRAFGLQTTETGRVVDVLTQAANKSNQTVLDLGESMKYAAPVAQSLGLPLEDLAATMGLLANNGIRGSDAGTALRTGLTRLQIAASGSNEELEGLTRGNVLLAKAMRSLGAEIIDTSGNLLPLDQVILRLRENLQGMSTGRRTEIAKALFGDEAGSKFLALMNSSEEQITNMFQAVRNSGGVAVETREKMRGFGDSIKVLGGNIENITNQIGGMIGMALKPLIDGLNAAGSAALKLPDPIKNIGAAAAAAGVAALAFAAGLIAIKTALAGIGGITAATAALKAYTATATGAGAASATAATQATTLLGVLAKLAGIGTIVVGVSLIVSGMAELNSAITEIDRLRARQGAGGIAGENPGGVTAAQRAEAQRTLDAIRAERQRMQGAGWREALIPGYTALFPGGARAGRERVLDLREQRAEATLQQPLRTTAPLPGATAAAGAAGAGATAARAQAAAAGLDGGTAASAAKQAGSSMAAQIAKALQDALSLTPAQAAGVVGNLMRESGLNPGINEGGAVGLPRGVGGYGLAQWTGSRQSDLVRFAGGGAAAGNMQTQLRFMISELLGPESKALASLRRAKSPEEAAVVFDRDYERSGIKALGERKANARKVFGELAGTGPAAGLSDYASSLREEADAAERLKEQQDNIKTKIEEQFALRTQSVQQINQESESLRAQSDEERLSIEHAYKVAQLQKQYKDAKEKVAELDKEATAAGMKSNVKDLNATIDQELKVQLSNENLKLERELNKIYDERRQKFVGPLQEQNQQLSNTLDDLRLRNRLTMEGVSDQVIEGELQKARAYRDQANDMRELNDLKAKADSPVDQEKIQSIINAVNEQYARQIDLINQSTAAQTQQGVALGIYVGQLKRELTELQNIENQVITMAGVIEQELSTAISTSISGLVSGTVTVQEAMGQMFKNIGDAFARMAAEIIAKQLIMKALDIFANVRAAAPGSFGAGQTFGFGDGGVMPSFDVPSLLPRAIGGPVTAGQPYPVGERGAELFVPYQSGTIIPAEVAEQLAAANMEAVRRLPISQQGNSASNLSVPFQGQGNGLTVPFMRDASGNTDGGVPGGTDGVIRFESMVINNQEFVTRDEAEKIGRRSEQRGAALAQRRLVNNPTVRRQAGIS